MQGNNNATATAVRANGYGGPLFVGNNHISLDVFTVDDAGNLFNAGNASVGGNSTVSGIMNVDGSAIGPALTVDSGAIRNYGIEGLGMTICVEGATAGTLGLAGIVGTNNTTSAAVYANGFGGPALQGQ